MPDEDVTRSLVREYLSAAPPVFLVDKLPDEKLIELSGDEARHLVTVRRIRRGEQVAITDGRGTLAVCRINEVEPGRNPSARLNVEQRWTEPQPALRVIVAQGLIKGDRGELAVELATEAGVDEIWPWHASRSIARWDDGPRGVKALNRWRTAAQAATKQARRAWIPQVTDPVTTAKLAERCGEVTCALVLEAGASDRLADVSLPPEGDILLIVGPEGGIDVKELAVFAEAGAKPIRLGPTVLRTSTAAAVALGGIGALTSRWP